MIFLFPFHQQGHVMMMVTFDLKQSSKCLCSFSLPRALSMRFILTPCVREALCSAPRQGAEAGRISSQMPKRNSERSAV